jgi:hypothetical protein
MVGVISSASSEAYCIYVWPVQLWRDETHRFLKFLYKYCRRPERCIHNTSFVTFFNRDSKSLAVFNDKRPTRYFIANRLDTFDHHTEALAHTLAAVLAPHIPVAPRVVAEDPSTVRCHPGSWHAPRDRASSAPLSTRSRRPRASQACRRRR